MTVKTSNYALSESHTFISGGDSRTLPQGAFVSPIDIYYVPQFILEKNPWFDKKVDIFCYTRFGMVPIPKHKVRER